MSCFLKKKGFLKIIPLFFEIQPIEHHNPKLVIKKKKKIGSGPHLCDSTLWLIISFFSAGFECVWIEAEDFTPVVSL